MFIKRATKATRRRGGRGGGGEGRRTIVLHLRDGWQKRRCDASGVAHDFPPPFTPFAAITGDALHFDVIAPRRCMRVVSIHVCALLLLQQRMQMQRRQRVVEEDDERDDLCVARYFPLPMSTRARF